MAEEDTRWFYFSCTLFRYDFILYIAIFEYSNIISTKNKIFAEEIERDAMKVNPLSFSAEAEILKAIAHPARLCIVRGLWLNGGCNVSHMQACPDAPQPTISQHLAKLRSAGIIEGERTGTEIIYHLKDARVKAVLSALFPKEEEA